MCGRVCDSAKSWIACRSCNFIFVEKGLVDRIATYFHREVTQSEPMSHGVVRAML
jgi:hypothetical protein